MQRNTAGHPERQGILSLMMLAAYHGVMRLYEAVGRVHGVEGRLCSHRPRGGEGLQLLLCAALEQQILRSAKGTGRPGRSLQQIAPIAKLSLPAVPEDCRPLHSGRSGPRKLRTASTNDSQHQ